MMNTVSKLLCAGAIAAFVQNSPAQSLNCAEFGGKNFCSAASKKPLHAFGSCFDERVEAVKRGEGEKLAPNWLEPAATAVSCMASQGVSESPPTRRKSAEYCENRGDVYTPDRLRFCKAGGSSDAFEVSMSYCRQTAAAFLELKMLPVTISATGHGVDPLNLQVISPCLAAQGWSVQKAQKPKPDPKQRPGETGSI